MSESANHDQNNPGGESQNSENQVNENFQQNLSENPTVAREVSGSVEDPNYWKNLVIVLMKRIPAAPSGSEVLPEHPPRSDKLVDRVARRNPKVYDGNLDVVELEDWIRGMEKIFTVVEVPEEKKVNRGAFYLAGEADIWWSTVKNKLQGCEFTWAKFLEKIRAKFYPITVQRQMEKEFMELKMSGNMTVTQYARKFMEFIKICFRLCSI